MRTSVRNTSRTPNLSSNCGGNPIGERDRGHRPGALNQHPDRGTASNCSNTTAAAFRRLALLGGVRRHHLLLMLAMIHLGAESTAVGGLFNH